MSAIAINSFLIIIAFCALAATLNKILHPQHKPAHQFLRTLWVMILALLMTVGLSSATAHVIEKELTLRLDLQNIRLQILERMRPTAPPAPKLPNA